MCLRRSTGTSAWTATFSPYNTSPPTGPADVAGRSFRNDEHTVKAGVNYRFGWGGPAASRY